MDTDATLLRLADLLEAALELVAGWDAPSRLSEIAVLCREAAGVAEAAVAR